MKKICTFLVASLSLIVLICIMTVGLTVINCYLNQIAITYFIISIIGILLLGIPFKTLPFDFVLIIFSRITKKIGLPGNSYRFLYYSIPILGGCGLMADLYIVTPLSRDISNFQFYLSFGLLSLIYSINYIYYIGKYRNFIFEEHLNS